MSEPNFEVGTQWEAKCCLINTFNCNIIKCPMTEVFFVIPVSPFHVFWWIWMVDRYMDICMDMFDNCFSAGWGERASALSPQTPPPDHLWGVPSLKLPVDTSRPHHGYLRTWYMVGNPHMWASGIMYQVSGIRYQVSGSREQVLSRYQVSGTYCLHIACSLFAHWLFAAYSGPRIVYLFRAS